MKEERWRVVISHRLELLLTFVLFCSSRSLMKSLTAKRRKYQNLHLIPFQFYYIDIHTPLFLMHSH